jgi:hypothetical protein
MVTLAGEYEVQVSSGETRRFGPGSVVLVEDLTGAGHVTRELSPPGSRHSLFIELAD